MIDLMLKFNKTAKKEDIIDEKMMVSNVSLFEIAGIDTTKSSTQSFFKVVSNMPKIVKKISEEELPKIFEKEQDWDNYDKYHESEFLNKVIDELMRLHGPSSFIFHRKATKDTKLGKYFIKKGESVSISLLGLHMNEENFENPEVFDIERFSKERKKNVKRNSYMPFYSGKRACIGKYLAELTLRMIVFRFLDMFELRGDGNEVSRVMGLTTTVRDCNVVFRPKC